MRNSKREQCVTVIDLHPPRITKSSCTPISPVMVVIGVVDPVLDAGPDLNYTFHVFDYPVIHLKRTHFQY